MAPERIAGGSETGWPQERRSWFMKEHTNIPDNLCTSDIW
jgi:hypothetical protein